MDMDFSLNLIVILIWENWNPIVKITCWLTGPLSMSSNPCILGLLVTKFCPQQFQLIFLYVIIIFSDSISSWKPS